MPCLDIAATAWCAGHVASGAHSATHSHTLVTTAPEPRNPKPETLKEMGGGRWEKVQAALPARSLDDIIHHVKPQPPALACPFRRVCVRARMRVCIRVRAFACVRGTDSCFRVDVFRTVYESE